MVSVEFTTELLQVFYSYFLNRYSVKGKQLHVCIVCTYSEHYMNLECLLLHC